MKQKGRYLLLLSLFLICMPAYGLIKCLPAALRGQSFPLDMVIFIPYGLLTGLVVLTAGFSAVKKKMVRRAPFYLSAFLPLGMAASALYFASKTSHIIMPVFACLIALAASFISFLLIIKNNTLKTT